VGTVLESSAGTGFSPEFFGFPLPVLFHRGYPYSYNLGDEQYIIWSPQFRDIVSPHLHEQQFERDEVTKIIFH
jgi:hypothetical protein